MEWENEKGWIPGNVGALGLFSGLDILCAVVTEVTLVEDLAAWVKGVPYASLNGQTQATLSASILGHCGLEHSASC